jgi:hypothetical protein
MTLSMEQNEYFDMMDALFMSEGWRLFVDDIKGFQEALKSQVLGIKEPRDLFFAQGRNTVFDQILTYQDMIEGAKKSLQEEGTDASNV